MIIRLRLLYGKPAFNIHSAMQNANDFDFAVLLLTIKDDMTADVNFSVAFPDVAAIPARRRIDGQFPEAFVEHDQIFIALFTAPMLLRVLAYFHQIKQCSFGKSE
jgi:hypothetical protein